MVMTEKKQTSIQSAGVMYQIYPRSFMDSNNDGVGDLKGIISKIGHLEDLGVNSVWLSPIYPSPMADFGYDISNYCDIDPMFGNLDEFDELVLEAKKSNIKIVMDYVANHSSDKHAWFKESLSSRTSSKRNWYVWADPAKDGGPPNNWLSIFGGSAWEFDENTEQYYLHTFLKEQPDLNWRNAEVKEAMMDVLRFWIERGVEGFRTDAYAHVMKDEKLRDEPINPNYKKGDWEFTKLNHTLTQRQPDLEKLYKYFDEVFDEYPDRELFMVTEDYAGIDDINWHYSHSNNNRFAPLNLGFSELAWNPENVQKSVNSYLTGLSDEYWPNFALGNHDLKRVSHRAGSDSTRIAALLQITLKGIPIIYYGDEIGMTDVYIPRDKIQDPVSFRDEDKEGRDPQRTPMQWDSTANAGFSIVEPWLPVGDNYKVINVETERGDSNSLLTLYKELISIRTKSSALNAGNYQVNKTNNKNLMSYWRESEDEKLLIVINFSDKPQKMKFETDKLRLVFSTNTEIAENDIEKNTVIPAFSGIIVK